MHGYELHQQIEARSIRQWAAIGLSSIYQTLDGLVAEGLLTEDKAANPGQGASYRTIYTQTERGRARLAELARAALNSTQHQRFDYDPGLGVALNCLSRAEVHEALKRRQAALQEQFVRAAASCEWAAQSEAAWIILDHQRRALEMELNWLASVIARLAESGEA